MGFFVQIECPACLLVHACSFFAAVCQAMSLLMSKVKADESSEALDACCKVFDDIKARYTPTVEVAVTLIAFALRG